MAYFSINNNNTQLGMCHMSINVSVKYEELNRMVRLHGAIAWCDRMVHSR